MKMFGGKEREMNFTEKAVVSAVPREKASGRWTRDKSTELLVSVGLPLMS